VDEGGKRFASGDKTALRTALENAVGYARLLRQHITKEDDILYQMADQALTPADQQKLLSKFEEVEQERIGAGKHEAYLKLVEDLERQLKLR
jgi:hemerythrin-like domain-containing protein